jgi:Protein  of unknown function (DUF3018)
MPAKRPGSRTAKARRPAKSSNQKVRAFRARMRAKGQRLIQMWVPDTKTAQFARDAARQSSLANRSAFAADDQAWTEAIANWKSGETR